MGGAYLSPFPDEVERRRLVVEDRRLGGGEVRILPQLAPGQAASLDLLVVCHPAGKQINIKII